jgi:4a-hydroxytetrahydrobiopterin dehydratase
MSIFKDEKRFACRANAPHVCDPDIKDLSFQVPDWKLIAEDNVRKLERSFRFSNFKKAMFFTQAVGGLAEEEGHYPRLVTEWGRVTVIWWTHKIKDLDLHRNDYIMARKANRLFLSFSS